MSNLILFRRLALLLFGINAAAGGSDYPCAPWPSCAIIILPAQSFSENPDACRERGLSAMYTCAPPARYVADPGHCVGDSPPYSPVIVLCGIPAP